MTLPADDALLAQFRQWLDATRAAAEALSADGPPTLAESTPARAETSQPGASPPAELPIPDQFSPAAATPAVGLWRLAEEFTALRHEIKLQTRSARGLEEEHAELRAALAQAIKAMQSVEPRGAQAAWTAGKGLALTLAELDEALDRGWQQLQKAGERLLRLPKESTALAVERAHADQSWLARRLTRDYHGRVRRILERETATDLERAQFQATLDGYALMMRRLAKALDTAEIVRVPTVGELVDPEQMIVLDVVAAPAPPGTVVEEVRRGYTWQGRILRCAEVRAAQFDSSGERPSVQASSNT